MSSRVCVIDLPGMSKELLANVPAETAFGKWLAGREVTALKPSWPAVTCSVQATITTGGIAFGPWDCGQRRADVFIGGGSGVGRRQ